MNAWFWIAISSALKDNTINTVFNILRVRQSNKTKNILISKFKSYCTFLIDQEMIMYMN